jgi:UDP-N-acetylmuramoylalanine--D-glutamate ligase
VIPKGDAISIMQFNAPLTRANWKGKRVLILGLGQFPQGSGISAALAFARAGADLTVTDLKNAADLSSNVKRLKRFKNVRFVLVRHDPQDIERSELVVANPRVRPNAPEMRLARKKGIPVASDIGLFLDRCPASVIAVTGTRGKSTTSSLIAAMLKASGKRVWLGGNILVSPLTFLSRVKSKDVVVLELSSWQCESLAGVHRVPHIAVVTNLLRDHLNAYDGMEDYAEAKAQIFRHQKKEDTVILNSSDEVGKRWMGEAPGIVKRFGSARGDDARLKKGEIHLGTTTLLPLKRMKLIGEHNGLNACAAALAAKEGGATIAGIRKALREFEPLPYRLETVVIRQGVRYVNDTCATTPDGAIAAIRALRPISNRIWLIAGGADKELDYVDLGKEIAKAKKRVSILLLPGDASDKLRNELIINKVDFEAIPSLTEGVRIASERAKRGDTVALSPAAASFNQFKNEFDRGETFKKVVGRI